MHLVTRKFPKKKEKHIFQPKQGRRENIKRNKLEKNVKKKLMQKNVK